MLGTIQKMGKVLKQFTLNHPDWGVSELATQLAMPRSTTHDLLQSLTDIGLLTQNAQGRYHVSWQVIRFAQNRLWSSALVLQAHQAMAPLRQFFHVTSYVALLEQGQVLFLLSNTDSQSNLLDLTHIVYEGASFSSAAGKVLWANQNWAEVEQRLLNAENIPANKASASDAQNDFAEAYRTTLQRTQADGYAVSVNEVVTDWGDIAVPIFDEHGRVIAAVGLIVPSQQLFDQSQVYQQSLTDIGNKLSQTRSSTAR